MVAIDAKESLATVSGVACTDAAGAGATSVAGAAQKPEVLLSLERAKKSFGDNQVLKDITLQVEKGQVVGIIGPSGGGKSTLLRCATMLETLDDGTLSYGDLVVCKDGAYSGKEVPCIPYVPFGTYELAQAALDGMGDNYACILGNHGLLCVGGNISYTLDVSEQIEFCAQLYYNCKAAGQEPKLLNDEQISSVLEAFQTYRQK